MRLTEAIWPRVEPPKEELAAVRRNRMLGLSNKICKCVRLSYASLSSAPGFFQARMLMHVGSQLSHPCPDHARDVLYLRAYIHHLYLLSRAAELVILRRR